MTISTKPRQLFREVNLPSGEERKEPGRTLAPKSESECMESVVHVRCIFLLVLPNFIACPELFRGRGKDRERFRGQWNEKTLHSVFVRDSHSSMCVCVCVASNYALTYLGSSCIDSFSCLPDQQGHGNKARYLC